MDMSFCTDSRRPAINQKIRLAHGVAYPLWERLIRFIESNYQLQRISIPRVIYVVVGDYEFE